MQASSDICVRNSSMSIVICSPAPPVAQPARAIAHSPRHTSLHYANASRAAPQSHAQAGTAPMHATAPCPKAAPHGPPRAQIRPL